MASRQCLGQKTVVGVMDKSREEAGFDAAQFSLFPYSVYLMLFSCINFTMVVCCVKGDNKKITIELDNNQAHEVKQMNKAWHMSNKQRIWS